MCPYTYLKLFDMFVQCLVYFCYGLPNSPVTNIIPTENLHAIFQFLFNGRSQVPNSCCYSFRELRIVMVHIPQHIHQLICRLKKVKMAYLNGITPSLPYLHILAPAWACSGEGNHNIADKLANFVLSVWLSWCEDGIESTTDLAG